MPSGNPETAIATESVNPLNPVIAVVKLEVDVPALAMIEVGDKAMLESGEQLTVNAREAECASAPDVPFITAL